MASLRKSLVSIFNLPRISMFLLLFSLFCAWQPGLCYSPTAALGVSTKNQTRFTVKISTSLRIPDSGPRPKNIRVWHALPPVKPWSRVNTVPGVTGLSFTPKFGKLELETDRQSGHIYYLDQVDLRPGAFKTYETSFELYSSDRTFDDRRMNCAWSQYSSKDYAASERVKSVPLKLRVLAERLKDENAPVAFVKAACQWAHDNLQYDANSYWSIDDVATTLANKRGHCGHLAAVVKNICLSAGVPFKTIVGLDLQASDGINADAELVSSGQAALGQPESNSHVWGEVYFPSIGWIEIDTVEDSDKCFTVPARMIQNNTSFQNCAVWLWEEGRAPRLCGFRFDGGKSSYEYDTKTVITFTKQRL